MIYRNGIVFLMILTAIATPLSALGADTWEDINITQQRHITFNDELLRLESALERMQQTYRENGCGQLQNHYDWSLHMSEHSEDLQNALQRHHIRWHDIVIDDNSTKAATLRSIVKEHHDDSNNMLKRAQSLKSGYLSLRFELFTHMKDIQCPLP